MELHTCADELKNSTKEPIDGGDFAIRGTEERPCAVFAQNSEES